MFHNQGGHDPEKKKRYPWNAPGTAPVASPCGTLGGWPLVTTCFPKQCWANIPGLSRGRQWKVWGLLQWQLWWVCSGGKCRGILLVRWRDPSHRVARGLVPGGEMVRGCKPRWRILLSPVQDAPRWSRSPDRGVLPADPSSVRWRGTVGGVWKGPSRGEEDRNRG